MDLQTTYMGLDLRSPLVASAGPLTGRIDSLRALHGRVDADLALTTGVHDGLDAVRALLAGATVAMMTSALLRHGPGHVAAVEAQLHVQGRIDLAGTFPQKTTSGRPW
jgi:hypothetical protein